MIAHSLHIVSELLQTLFPGYGFIIEVHPTENRPGKPAMISNMQDSDIIRVMKEYIEKHKQGEVHANNSKPLQN